MMFTILNLSGDQIMYSTGLAKKVCNRLCESRAGVRNRTTFWSQIYSAQYYSYLIPSGWKSADTSPEENCKDSTTDRPPNIITILLNHMFKMRHTIADATCTRMIKKLCHTVCPWLGSRITQPRTFFCQLCKPFSIPCEE